MASIWTRPTRPRTWFVLLALVLYGLKYFNVGAPPPFPSRRVFRNIIVA
jgi:hypothetical protein